MNTEAMIPFKTYINDDPEDFIIELSNAFYIDNNNKELTNSQLQYIALKLSVKNKKIYFS